MPAKGQGAIVIWNDIASEGRREFYLWHMREHIPERVALPGFLRGGRYIALDGNSRPEFLTLYETAGPDIATSAPYLARLNDPTPRTRRATAHFRNTLRALTEVAASGGCGTGGMIATIRFDDSAAGRAAFTRLAPQAEELIGMIAGMDGVSAAHLCTTNSSASAARTAESRDRTDIMTPPIAALLVEGTGEDPVRAALAARDRELGIGREGVHLGLYRLEHALSKIVASVACGLKQDQMK
jgi:hypothetical protein